MIGIFKNSRGIIWLAVVAIALLAVLSVVGAFLGAEQAREFFNSIPMRIYWLFLLLLLVEGFIVFPRLLRKPALFLVHAGCVLVLMGAMSGSQAGHNLAKRFFGIDKIPRGYMVIFEGDSENRVVAEDYKSVADELPFSIRLVDFRIEYYESGKEAAAQLQIETADGRHLQIAAEAGREISPDGKSKVTVVRTFRNFKIHREGENMVAVDEGGDAENPAIEVKIERPDGTSVRRYVFERFETDTSGQDGFKLSFMSQSQSPRMIRDFFSDVVVVKNGKDVLSKTIEVNRPLHFGGYHFYQDSYDSAAGQYTILSVTSDSGLYAVYAGYSLLTLGIFWQFWFAPAIGYVKNRDKK